MSNKKSKNKTKNLISFALYTLMLKHEYEELTVKEICEKANVSRMSFYRYYSKKEDIFIDYTDERFEEFYEKVHKMNDLTTYTFILEMFKFIKQYSRQLKMLRKAKKEFLLLNQFNNYAAYVTRNIKTERFEEKRNNPLYPSYVAGGMFNILMIWLDNDLKTSPETMTEMLHNII